MTSAISVLDVHGVDDTTIPSNTTVSDDFWLYETTSTNMEYFKKYNNPEFNYPF